jgi:rod shape-determining protein MreD
MAGTAIGRMVLFVLLILLQITLFDKIHVFGCATPLLYIYFILKLPGGMNRNLVLVLSAVLGLCIDIFDHTMGMNMLACVVGGFSRRFFLDWFVPRDVHEDYVPSFRSLGMGIFLRYACAMTLLHHVVLFVAEAMSLLEPLVLLSRIVGSAILTLLLIFACESINFESKRK